MVRRRFERVSAPIGGLSLTAKGVLVVAIPVVALLVSTALFYAFQRQTNQAQSWVEHTLEVRSHIRDALLQLANAESGLRGYLLTHSDRELENYQAAREKLPQPIQALQKLIVDNPPQIERL